ncbi:uncharacterized protein [Heterodontus francisci]|uniref:uncharacterized protein n=1 Tax=Heterodontus francisci TaxID=7792 RepID=UPI00355BD25B
MEADHLHRIRYYVSKTLDTIKNGLITYKQSKPVEKENTNYTGGCRRINQNRKCCLAKPSVWPRMKPINNDRLCGIAFSADTFSVTANLLLRQIQNCCCFYYRSNNRSVDKCTTWCGNEAYRPGISQKPKNCSCWKSESKTENAGNPQQVKTTLVPKSTPRPHCRSWAMSKKGSIKTRFPASAVFCFYIKGIKGRLVPMAQRTSVGVSASVTEKAKQKE